MENDGLAKIPVRGNGRALNPSPSLRQRVSQDLRLVRIVRGGLSRLLSREVELLVNAATLPLTLRLGPIHYGIWAYISVGQMHRRAGRIAAILWYRFYVFGIRNDLAMLWFLWTNRTIER